MEDTKSFIPPLTKEKKKNLRVGKRRKMLLPQWETNLTPPALRAGILTTRPRGHLSFSAYRRVIVSPHCD